MCVNTAIDRMVVKASEEIVLDVEGLRECYMRSIRSS